MKPEGNIKDQNTIFFTIKIVKTIVKCRFLLNKCNISGLQFLGSSNAKEKEQTEVVGCPGQNLSPMRKQGLFSTRAS